MAMKPTCIPVPLTERVIDDIIPFAKECAFTQGIMMKTAAEPTSCEVLSYSPFSLIPTPIPRKAFNAAYDVQTAYNLLYHRVAHDHEFLKNSLSGAVEVDDFTRNLWNIYETVRREGINQNVSLCLHRSDYMVDTSSNNNIKQIEFNTIASSFAGLSSRIGQMHRFILQRLGHSDLTDKIPANCPMKGLAEGLVAAWDVYNNKDAAILFVVERFTRNSIDKRWHHLSIYEHNPDIKVIWKNFKEINATMTLREDKTLVVDGVEIAVAYFRTGYTESDYYSEEEWSVRLTLERSKAIKCPTIQYQLSGCKKVQQELCRDGVIEKYIPDENVAKQLRLTFARQYSLDQGPEGDHAISMALKEPMMYVMKPQREGGGNNTYGSDIPPLLEQIKDSDERKAYILMQRIFPCEGQNYLIYQGAPVSLRNTISELGIYGILLGSPEEVMLNKSVGHMLRTKTAGADEGGVMAGASVIDSPFLID